MGISIAGLMNLGKRLPKVLREPRPQCAASGTWLSPIGDRAKERLFLPVVRKVVFHTPGFPTVGRSLAELTHLVRSLLEKLQMTPEFRTLRLRLIVGIEIQHALFQPAIEVNHAPDVIHPQLLPPFQTAVIHVVTLAAP